MERYAYSVRIESGNVSLYTLVALPNRDGRFPVILYRSPYVDNERTPSDAELEASMLTRFKEFLDGGYAVIWQHCRGRGKSTGDCIPYINEREDGLALHDWVRKQSFYCGELYLLGGSYTSSVHYVTAPWEDDVKGAILEVQDSERYNCNYRNGFYKAKLHGAWYFGMYKKNSMPKKSFCKDSYQTLPLSALSEIATGEHIPDFDEILRHPRRDDPFWKTRYGGGEAQGAISHARIPILLTTGFYDIYTGGIFDMWRALDDETRALSALLVHPYDHGGSPDHQPVAFENGMLKEQFPSFKLRWLDAIRGKNEFPVTRGQVTYYELFGKGWRTDGFKEPGRRLTFPLGDGEVTYRYNPYAPATFRGGLSTNFDGAAYQDPPSSRYDIVSLFTPEFTEDTVVKGRMTARLTVRSTAEDTCFYVRTSLVTEAGDYGLRDDITQISNVSPSYVPGDTVVLDFTLDDHAFRVGKGQKLRIDISSSACPYYVRHTNSRGLFSEMETAKAADNTVVLSESFLTVPVEEARETNR